MTSDPKKTHKSLEFKHDRPMTACRFSPSGKFLFSGAEDNLAHRWLLPGGERTDFAGHDSWVRAFAFSADDAVTFTGAYDGRIKWWPPGGAEAKPLRTLDAHNGWVRALAVSPDGNWLASCGNDNLVNVWNTKDGSQKWSFAGHARHVYNVAFHPDGRNLVSGDLMGVVKQWDITTGKLVRDLDANVLSKYDKTFRADIGGIRGMAFNADGTLLACSGITDVTNAFAGIGKPMVVLFDWKSGQGKQLRPAKDFGGAAWNVRFHPDGYLVVVGGGRGGGALWFFKLDAKKSFHTFKLPNDGRDMDLHPDGLQVAVAHANKTIGIYRLAEKDKPAK